MSAGAPWSVKGIDPKAREVAKDLARRSGMTLGEWLNRVILEDDVPEEVTAEVQFADRALRAQAPRLRAIPSPPSSPPDLARIAHALDRLTDRIEASETRTGLAINGVEHSVRQALARIETAEREQHAAATRLEGLLAEASAEQSYFGERLRRMESDAGGGPRSIEALRLIESRLSRVEPELVVETVLQRLGDRLAAAEARTASALDGLKGALVTLDHRVGAVEGEGDARGEARFEALAQVLTHRVEAVRAEVADKIATAGGEARFAELAEQVRAAERRSAQAVEDIGRQVLSMAEAVGKKLIEVDQRGAEAIDQVGSEIARIAGAVEQRLARGEHAQAEAFERFGAELAAISERIAAAPAPAAPAPEPEAAPERAFAPEPEVAAEPFAALADEAPTPDAAAADDPLAFFPPQASVEAAAEAAAEAAEEPAAESAIAAAFDPLAEAMRILGPPPEPEPEAALEPMAAAFGPELYSRAEDEADVADLAVASEGDTETVAPPWRRLDLEIPEPRIPETFHPIDDEDDEDLFQSVEPIDPIRELSTRQVIEQARATARAAQEAKAAGPAKVSAKMKAAASGRLFAGFTSQKTKTPPRHSALQTALLVAGGAAFMSVGAAGLTLMQAPKDPPQAPEPLALTPDGSPARASMALGPASFATAPKPQPSFEKVRADVEAAVPGALDTLKSLAEANHAQAQLYLAQLYDEGEAGLPQNPAEARRLTTMAAENGDVKAMHNLGVYLFRGEGGPQDLTGAARWFGKAATNGVVESQYNLGLLYQSGSGLPKDLVRARAWFERAAASGDEQARKALADMGPRPQAKAAAPAAAASLAPARSMPAHSMNVRQTQLVLTRLGYYDGPLDGRASVAYDRALAEYRRDQAGGPPLHVYQR